MVDKRKPWEPGATVPTTMIKGTHYVELSVLMEAVAEIHRRQDEFDSRIPNYRVNAVTIVQ